MLNKISSADRGVDTYLWHADVEPGPTMSPTSSFRTMSTIPTNSWATFKKPAIVDPPIINFKPPKQPHDVGGARNKEVSCTGIFTRWLADQFLGRTNWWVQKLFRLSQSFWKAFLAWNFNAEPQKPAHHKFTKETAVLLWIVPSNRVGFH